MADIKEIVKRERATLEWIRHKTARYGRCIPLFQSAESALRDVGDAQHGMSVMLDWKVPHEGRDDVLAVHVGCEIRIDENIIVASHLLSVSEIGKEGKPGRILRKYHFDYANPDCNSRNSHPVFHVQYAGRLPSRLTDVLDDSHLNPEFDEPRLLYSPMSLALLLHTTFREFPDKYTERIRQDGGWLGRCVRRDQREVLKPFYQRCLDLIEDNDVVMDYAYDG